VWDWIWIFAISYGIFIVIEEANYYFWNRYVFGAKEVLRRNRIRKVIRGYFFVKRIAERNLQQ
jgi:hypothetical protein